MVPEFARGTREADVALAPGMKYRHYAPSKPLFLVECGDVEAWWVKPRNWWSGSSSMKARERRCSAAARHAGNTRGVTVVDMGHRGDLYEVARKLFAALRLVDDLDVDVAVAEGFPELGIGLAIMNRLRKASGFSIIKCGD